MKLDKIKFKGGIKYLLLSSVIVMGLISIIATGGGDGGGGTADTGSGTGTLSLSMTDSIADDLAEVWVKIVSVSVHTSVDEETGSWEDIDGTFPLDVNLMGLRNGNELELGEVTLEAGHYTQIRLILDTDDTTEPPYKNYVVTKPTGDPPTSEELPLQISSQDETGIKLVKGFDIESGVVTALVLDWDVERSIMKNPQGYKLKPTIKILDVVVSSSISGVVTDTEYPEGEEPPPIPDALVTAQVVDGDYASVVASTTTGDDGGYLLTLEGPEEGEEAIPYNIVVYTEGYSPVCTTIEIESATDLTENFPLTSVEDTGTISGGVVINTPDENITYEISIQQDSVDCGNTIVIVYNSVAYGDEYSATLPAGTTYYVVASTIDQDGVTQTQNIKGTVEELGINATETVDVDF